MRPLMTGIAFWMIGLAFPLTSPAALQPAALPGPAPAASASGRPPAPDDPRFAEAIGVVAAVKGSVEIIRPGGSPAKQTAQSGAPVFHGDEIVTGADSRFQLLLRDETTFTLGENARITMDEFVYDPATREGTVAATISRGAFRFITGQVARKNPKKMSIRLPVGTIGIRGTMGAGRTSDRPGETTSVVLLGPGRNNSTGDTPGGITVGNDSGSEDIGDPGFGTEIQDAGTAPTEPRQFSSEELNDITGGLDSAPDGSPAGGQEDSGAEGGPTATEEAGQDKFESVEITEDAGEGESVQQILDTATSKSAQDASNANVASANRIADGISTFDQLRTLDSGMVTYTINGTLRDTSTSNFNAELATYTLSYDINFATKKAGGTSTSKISGTPSDLTVNNGNGFTFPLGEINYSDTTNNSGNAVFTYTSLADSSCPNCTANASITLNNSGGTIGANADHTFTLNESATTGAGSGNGTGVRS